MKNTIEKFTVVALTFAAMLWLLVAPVLIYAGFDIDVQVYKNLVNLVMFSCVGGLLLLPVWKRSTIPAVRELVLNVTSITFFGFLLPILSIVYFVLFVLVPLAIAFYLSQFVGGMFSAALVLFCAVIGRHKLIRALKSPRILLTEMPFVLFNSEENNNRIDAMVRRENFYRIAPRSIIEYL